MCSSVETIHKNSGRFGNFVLSPPAIRASIFLHVKTPDVGGAALSPALRRDGEAAWRVGDFRVPGSNKVRAVLRELRFPPALPRRPSGRRQQGAAAFGPGIGPVSSGSFGSFQGSGGTPPGFGDGRPLRRRPVRRRKPGCPAVPGFRREGVGRASAPPFRQGRLPFPVSGSRTIRDRAGSARKSREGLTGR